VFVCTFWAQLISHNVLFLDLHIATLLDLDIGIVSTNFREFHRDLSIDGLFSEIIFFTGRQIKHLFDEGLGHFYVDSFGDFI